MSPRQQRKRHIIEQCENKQQEEINKQMYTSTLPQNDEYRNRPHSFDTFLADQQLLREQRAKIERLARIQRRVFADDSKEPLNDNENTPKISSSTKQLQHEECDKEEKDDDIESKDKCKDKEDKKNINIDESTSKSKTESVVLCKSVQTQPIVSTSKKLNKIETQRLKRDMSDIEETKIIQKVCDPTKLLPCDIMDELNKLEKEGKLKSEQDFDVYFRKLLENHPQNAQIAVQLLQFMNQNKQNQEQDREEIDKNEIDKEEIDKEETDKEVIDDEESDERENDLDDNKEEEFVDIPKSPRQINKSPLQSTPPKAILPALVPIKIEYTTPDDTDSDDNEQSDHDKERDDDGQLGDDECHSITNGANSNSDTMNEIENENENEEEKQDIELISESQYSQISDSDQEDEAIQQNKNNDKRNDAENNDNKSNDNKSNDNMINTDNESDIIANWINKYPDYYFPPSTKTDVQVIQNFVAKPNNTRNTTTIQDSNSNSSSTDYSLQTIPLDDDNIQNENDIQDVNNTTDNNFEDFDDLDDSAKVSESLKQVVSLSDDIEIVNLMESCKKLRDDISKI